MTSAAKQPAAPRKAMPKPAQRQPERTTAAPRPARSAPTEAELARLPGQPLDPQSAARFSAAFGHDFSRVQVHTDEQAAASAASLGAAAYTRGRHIVLGSGRYAPGTPEGGRLLAHEAAHVAQQARSGTPRPGVGPAGAAAERRADQAAALLVSGHRQPLPGELLRPIEPRERPFELQRQTVTLTKSGTSVFKEERFGLAEKQYGPPIGFVEVRTGAEVKVGKSRVESNLLSIEYGGTGAGTTSWLQFIWVEMTAVTPAGTGVLDGVLPTTGGNLPFTTNTATPTWGVDAPTKGQPLYESAGVVIRDSQSVTMFDRPGGSSAGPLANAVFNAGLGATSVTFTAHFDTYLLRNHVPAYHVPWAASTTFTKPKGALVTGPVTYTLGKPGNVSALPANLAAVLKAHSPKFKVGP